MNRPEFILVHEIPQTHPQQPDWTRIVPTHRIDGVGPHLDGSGTTMVVDGEELDIRESVEEIFAMLQPTAQKETEEESQARFERYVLTQEYHDPSFLARNGEEYDNGAVQNEWQAWQAALELKG